MARKPRRVSRSRVAFVEREEVNRLTLRFDSTNFVE
jgi:hypothetical protein